MVEEFKRFRGKEVYPPDNLSDQERLEEARMAIKKSPTVHSIRIPFTRHGGVFGILSALEVAVNPYAAWGEQTDTTRYLKFTKTGDQIKFWIDRKP